MCIMDMSQLSSLLERSTLNPTFLGVGAVIVCDVLNSPDTLVFCCDDGRTVICCCVPLNIDDKTVKQQIIG